MYGVVLFGLVGPQKTGPINHVWGAPGGMVQWGDAREFWKLIVVVVVAVVAVMAVVDVD